MHVSAEEAEALDNMIREHTEVEREARALAAEYRPVYRQMRARSLAGVSVQEQRRQLAEIKRRARDLAESRAWDPACFVAGVHEAGAAN